RERTLNGFPMSLSFRRQSFRRRRGAADRQRFEERANGEPRADELAPLARVLDVERPAGRAADGGEAFVARDLDVERLPDVFVDAGVGHGHPRYRVSRYRVSGCGEDPAFGIGHKRCKTATAYWDSGNVGTGPRVALRDADPWSPAPCGVAQ